MSKLVVRKMSKVVALDGYVGVEGQRMVPKVVHNGELRNVISNQNI